MGWTNGVQFLTGTGVATMFTMSLGSLNLFPIETGDSFSWEKVA